MTGDERAVANLVHRLALAIDDGDLDEVERLFGAGTFVLDGRPARHGGAAFRRTIEQGMRRYEDGRPSTIHQITGLVVEVDDATGRASARSAVTVLQARPDLPLQPVLAGRYRDTFVRVGDGDGGWAWEERRMVVDLVGDTSHHTPNRLDRS